MKASRTPTASRSSIFRFRRMKARLHPDLWGHIRFIKERRTEMMDLLDPSLLEPELDDDEKGSFFELDF